MIDHLHCIINSNKMKNSRVRVYCLSTTVSNQTSSYIGFRQHSNAARAMVGTGNCSTRYRKIECNDNTMKYIKKNI